MRMRKKKHGAERIAACADLLIPKDDGVDPRDCFAVKRPICLEIGCGKGGFACAMSAKDTEHNLVALEKCADAACLALEKAKATADTRPDNLKFIIADATELTKIFAPHSVECIYLNFSDPWPKSGYYKRRLTYKTFLDLYREILVPGGLLKQKTDNENLFDFSLEQFETAGLTVEMLTRDLHHSEFADGNVMTEYESQFVAQGKPIFAVNVRF